jgi:hypothetical protein
MLGHSTFAASFANWVTGFIYLLFLCLHFIIVPLTLFRFVSAYSLGSIRNARVQLFTNEPIALDDPNSMALQKRTFLLSFLPSLRVLMAQAKWVARPVTSWRLRSLSSIGAPSSYSAPCPPTRKIRHRRRPKKQKSTF